MGITECLHDNTENKEIKTEREKDEKIYSGEGIFISNRKTIIESMNKLYKEIDVLSFEKRRELAKRLILLETEEAIDKALKYNNVSYEIISKSNEYKDNHELLLLFNINESKKKFENLIYDIINSVDWDKVTLIKKYNEYKQILNNRIKFNQPIEVNNKPLFFYKSKIHILLDLIQDNSITQFQEKLKIKREVYKEINLDNIIANNQYPEDNNKLKLFMIILILVDDKELAYYMLCSISDENKETIYYYNIIKTIIDKEIVVYNGKFLLLNKMIFDREQYSLNALIYSLKKYGLKNISLTNVNLYKYTQKIYVI